MGIHHHNHPLLLHPIFLLLPLLFILFSALFPAFPGQPCPFFGDSQCPEGFLCQFDRCLDDAGKEPVEDCSKLRCGRDAECKGAGKCVPYAGRPCGRNVLIGEGLARAIVSDCGPRGRCIGGRCSIDRCADVLCEDASELCRDGLCTKLGSVLCFSPFDCGPPSLYECRQNKCQRRLDTLGPVYSRPTPKCDPGDVLSGDKCVSGGGQDGCAQLVCPPGQSCFNGAFCVPSSGTNCAHSGECPEHSLCREGRCVADICTANGGKCPPEHACSPMSQPEGECRHLQGLLCSNSAAADDCPPPYFCIGGVCTKDECHRKVCQIGERCDAGICIRVEGNSCRDALKDCGQQFGCVDGMCRDQITVHVAAKEAAEAAAGKMPAAGGQ